MRMRKYKHRLFSVITFLAIAVSPLLYAEGDQAKIDEGKQLYQQNCVFCHQADAIGKPGFAPSLSNPEFLSIASDKFILGTIRDGRAGTGMPPFAHLGREKGRAILTYLRSFAKLPDRIEEVNAQPDAHGDPRLGEQWFHYICSTCHGPKGDGYAAGSTGTAIGKIGLLGKASDGFLRTTIKEGRSNTRMRGFSGSAGLANLADQEIEDIIVYLRTLAKTTPAKTTPAKSEPAKNDAAAKEAAPANTQATK